MLLQSVTARAAAAAVLANVVWQGADVVITECVNKNQVGAGVACTEEAVCKEEAVRSTQPE